MSATFDSLADEGAGVLALYVLGVHEISSLIDASADGDVRATRLLKAAVVSIENVATAPEQQPMPCGGCGRPVRRHDYYRVGLAVPNVDLPGRAMGFVLCRHCCSTDATADAAAIQAVQDVWPNARPVVITHPGRVRMTTPLSTDPRRKPATRRTSRGGNRGEA